MGKRSAALADEDIEPASTAVGPVKARGSRSARRPWKFPAAGHIAVNNIVGRDGLPVRRPPPLTPLLPTRLLAS